MSQFVQLGVVTPPLPLNGPLVDRFGRTHSDLRISVTDRCNIRCFYCMPETGAPFIKASNLLTFDEITRFTQTAVGLGINKIRLTGGEPLLRPRLPQLIERLAVIDGIRDLAVTTNAVLLAELAQPLYAAGLRRLNVHLDTLDRERFRQIARRDDLPRVLAGLAEARRMGFPVVKLNAVAVKGLSEPDLVPLVRYGRENGMEVRFIEFMPLDAQNLWSLDSVLTARQMIAQLEGTFGPLTPVPDADPRAPATEYAFADGYRVGFIASVSQPFCLNCNRLRLTSDGNLRYCLFAHEETNVRPLLHASPDSDSEFELEQAIRATVWRKWIGHEINRQNFVPPARPMYSIGG